MDQLFEALSRCTKGEIDMWAPSADRNGPTLRTADKGGVLAPKKLVGVHQ